MSDQLEARLRKESDTPLGVQVVEVELLREAAAELARLRAANDALVVEMSRYGREAGEAQGRLETSEMVGVVDGWRERAERAESELARLREREGRLVGGLREIARANGGKPVDDYTRGWSQGIGAMATKARAALSDTPAPTPEEVENG